jgi:integrase
MARSLHRLTDLQVQRAKKPGLLNDGGGLNLLVGAGGRRSWIFRYFVNSGERRKGLGAYPAVGLAQARERAAVCRCGRAAGIDPIDASEAERAEKADAGEGMSFAEATAAFLAIQNPRWGNAKHQAQWFSTLETYAFPVFGDQPVSAVDRNHVLAAVKPIWVEKHETARRLRGRIESVLDWATGRGLRAGVNPALKGSLKWDLPALKVKPRHHPALDPEELPAFFAALRAAAGPAARALELLILTAVRTGDIIGQPDRTDTPPLCWEHLDLAKALWIIPRAKNDSEHRVPLSAPALAVLTRMQAGLKKRDGWSPDAVEGAKPAASTAGAEKRSGATIHAFRRRLAAENDAHGGGVVFSSPDRPGEPLSNGAMLALLKRMGRGDITPHGMRSCFKTWSEHNTPFKTAVIEACLSHRKGDKLEEAYNHGDFLAQRRELMAAWGAFATATEKLSSATKM